MTTIENVAASGSEDAHGWLDALVAAWTGHRSRTSAAEAVYLALRDVLTAGHVGPGMHLAEPAIAEALGISRTPVREALQRLESEGLASRTTGRRLVVATVSPEEVLDVYVVREALNGLAARLAAQNASANDLVKLRRIQREMTWAYEGGDVARMAERNTEFHDAICVASRNAFLLELLRKAHDAQHRYPGSTFSIPQRSTQSLAEHEEILAAIENRDVDRAGALAEQHTANARRSRIEMLDGSIEERRRQEQRHLSASTSTDAPTGMEER